MSANVQIEEIAWLAIRLQAVGNPGIDDLLEALRDGMPEASFDDMQAGIRLATEVVLAALETRQQITRDSVRVQ